MTGFFMAIALWILGGWVGAQLAELFNRGNKLKFWGRVLAGVLGGVILGWTLQQFPLLEPVAKFLHNGNVEDAIAGVLGGFVFGSLARFLAWLKTAPPDATGGKARSEGG